MEKQKTVKHKKLYFQLLKRTEYLDRQIVFLKALLVQSFQDDIYDWKADMDFEGKDVFKEIEFREDN